MTAPVRALARRALRTAGCLAAPLLALLALTAVALACVGPAEPTTLTTSLSGEGKSGASITVLEGAKAKDQATLEGKNAAKATGKISYAVYKDSLCKELVTKAGEFEFKEGKVPASEEKALEGGRAYYWQASYGGDSLDAPSTSACGSEVLTVKAKTSLATSLVGGGEEGKEITIADGFPVIDTATLNDGESEIPAATGVVEYAVYSDSKCEQVLTNAGEGAVEGGQVPASEEVDLKAGATYHWRASYGGDDLHAAAVSPCDEAATIVASTSLTTSLSGEGREGQEDEEEEIESEITVVEGSAVRDAAALSGANAASATGTVKYSVYSDLKCEDLVAEAGEVTVEGANVPPSGEVTLEPGAYFWQAVYSGDSDNYTSAGPCGAEIEIVTPPLTTTLSGGGESEAEIEVLVGTPVSDEATLHGEHAGEATGTVKYLVYADAKCEELVAEAGEVNVKGASVPPSNAEELKAGAYYWRAQYSGDAKNPPATSGCGSEMAVVVTPTTLTASLSGGGGEGSEIVVEEGTAVSDQATLSGTQASTAEGDVEYAVYADSECTELAALAGDVQVSEGEVPPSSEVTLPAGTYYWQAQYTGDGRNHPASDSCGSAIATVTWPITLSLSAGAESGAEVEVLEETPVVGEATLHGEHAAEATGTVTYSVYSDPSCEELVAEAGEVSVGGASVPPSNAEELESGTYYWQGRYSGDANNPPATSICAPVRAVVMNPAVDKYAALGDSFSSGEGVAHRDRFGHAGVPYYEPTDFPPWWRLGRARNRCHRSPAAWPALVASAIYGGGGVVTAESEVFKRQPPKFIFRACSGAETINIWREGGGAPAEKGGQWDEVIGQGTPLLGIWNAPNPAQALWLTEPGGLLVPGGVPLPNETIRLLTMTIGGNDAGFRDVVEECVQWPLEIRYEPIGCLITIREEERNGFAAIAKRLPFVLTQVRKWAPNARIRIPMYPDVVNLKVGNIPVAPGGGGWLRLNNVVWEFIQGPNRLERLTAARAVSRFVWRLNTEIDLDVEAWVAKNGGDVRVVPRTEGALLGHRLGDAKPWLNSVVVPRVVESFHPSVCGHRALALDALPMVRGGLGAPPELC
jgi:hypothetical protein